MTRATAADLSAAISALAMLALILSGLITEAFFVWALGHVIAFNLLRQRTTTEDET